MVNTITIEKLVHGGYGLGRTPDGLTVFVSDALPGEVVQVELFQMRRDYAFARISSLLEPSPDRTVPQCQYYPSCGGCQLQHASYASQLDLKRDILKDCLSRALGQGTSCDIAPVFPSMKEFGYRHRLRLQVDRSTGQLGFLKRGTHDLVPIRTCLLAAPEINRVLDILPSHPVWRRLSPFAECVIFGVSPAESLLTMLIVFDTRPARQDIEALTSELPGLKAVFCKIKGEITGPFPKGASDGGKRLFPLPVNTLKRDGFYKVTPGVFVQNNWEVNCFLVNRVLEISEGGKKDAILDLHCGMGNFLLPLARGASYAVGVDSEKKALSDARNNARSLGLQVELIDTTDAQACLELLERAESFDLILLDPPRGGCKKVISFMPDLAKRILIYISCDPPTLARDLRQLLRQGFIIKDIQAFDMFPQTFHQETLAVLEKRNPS